MRRKEDKRGGRGRTTMGNATIAAVEKNAEYVERRTALTNRKKWKEEGTQYAAGTADNTRTE